MTDRHCALYGLFYTLQTFLHCVHRNGPKYIGKNEYNDSADISVKNSKTYSTQKINLSLVQQPHYYAE